MKPFPPLPPVAETDLGDGHLWVQELVAGEPLRFRLDADGTLTFGNRQRPLSDPPVSVRPAAL